MSIERIDNDEQKPDGLERLTNLASSANCAIDKMQQIGGITQGMVSDVAGAFTERERTRQKLIDAQRDAFLAQTDLHRFNRQMDTVDRELKEQFQQRKERMDDFSDQMHKAVEAGNWDAALGFASQITGVVTKSPLAAMKEAAQSAANPRAALMDEYPEDD